MHESDLLLVFLHLDLEGSATLPSIHLAALTGDNVYAQSLQRNLEIFLGGGPTLQLLNLASILLIWLMFSGYTEGWSLRCVLFDLMMFPGGFIAYWICFFMYPLSLEVFLRNSIPSWMLSLSPIAVALCIKIAWTPCLLDAWWCDPVFSRDWT
jgi:hypothetical protein